MSRPAVPPQLPLLPRGARAVDLGVLSALGALALLGLAPTFTGTDFVVVGVLGLLLAGAVTHVCAALRWPAIAPVVLVVLVLFLLGGPLCLRSQGASAWLPGPETLGRLVDQLLFGWKDLLTTLPPVDGDGPLLVLPWTMGLVAGVCGVLLLDVAAGHRRPVPGRVALLAVLPLLAPLALLISVILLGVRHPHSLLLQGSAFALLSLMWLALRDQRTAARTGSRSGGLRRLGEAVVLLVVAASLALPISTWASGSDRGRVVLRTYVEPPFDIGRYPSPLASFRRYVELPDPETDPVNLYDDPLLRVEGAPAGTQLRIATLDEYDGVVWGAGEDTVPGSTVDTFRRVSSTIDNPVAGERLEVTVTVAKGWSGVWLPTIGALQSLEFEGADAETSAETFRYNLATSTAVVPSGLSEGDRYSFEAAVPDDELGPDSAPAANLGDATFAAAFLEVQATQWSAGETELMRRVFAAAEHLKTEGKYSDGVREEEKIYHAGHHVKRLGDEFVAAPIMVGNDEQYAAVMALVAARIGVPARVVLGAVVPAGGVVTGADVSAWVELQVADGSWRTLPTETFMDFDRPAEQPPQTEQEMSGVVVPPPAPIPPPSTAGEQTDAELKARRSPRDSESDDDSGLPGWVRAVLLYVGGPLLLVVTVLAAVVLLKAARRRRRRNAVRTSARIVGAWRELVDHARDLGQPVPLAGGVTRREQAAFLASGAARQLARSADGHVFGPTVPAGVEAASYWAAVDAERRVMSRAVGRRRRALAACSVRTFRPGPRPPRN